MKQIIVAVMISVVGVLAQADHLVCRLNVGQLNAEMPADQQSEAHVSLQQYRCTGWIENNKMVTLILNPPHGVNDDLNLRASGLGFVRATLADATCSCGLE